MISFSKHSRIFAALLCTAAIAGCGEDEAEESITDAPSVPVAREPATLSEKRGFFNPKKGESWIYRVTREVPITNHLNDYDALRVVKKHEHHYELAFDRKRVCGGPITVPGTEKELVLTEIFEDDLLAEQEYFEISEQGLFGRGFAKPGERPIIIETPIPIAVPGMEGGNMWRGSASAEAPQYKFRVIDRTTLELPAGTFDVAQVQITSGNAMSSLKRTLWFAENVGIVKEVATYYDATSIRIRESSELVAWHLPNGLAARQYSNSSSAETATTGPVQDEEAEDDL